MNAPQLATIDGMRPTSEAAHAPATDRATPPLGDAPTQLLRTQVHAIDGPNIQVTAAECRHAVTAFSCLIAPRVGDTVLLALNPADGGGHILGILERPGRGDSSLTLPGGATLQNQDGTTHLQAKRLHVEASEDISLHGARGVRLDADEQLQLGSRRDLALRATSASLTAVTAQTTVKHWQGWFDTLQMRAVTIEYAAKTLSAKLGRVLSRALESIHRVEGLNELRAGRSRTLVRDHCETRAGDLTECATGFVRIDGRKIDIG